MLTHHVEYARNLRASLGKADAREHAHAYVESIAQRTKNKLLVGLTTAIVASCGLIAGGVYGSGWEADVALALAALAAFMAALTSAMLFQALREADRAVKDADEFVDNPSLFVRAHRGIFL